MTTTQQNPDGTWSPAVPIGPIPGWDAEVAATPDGRHQWWLYLDCIHVVAEGTTDTATGARLAIAWARWRNRRAGIKTTGAAA